MYTLGLVICHNYISLCICIVYNSTGSQKIAREIDTINNAGE